MGPSFVFGGHASISTNFSRFQVIDGSEMDALVLSFLLSIFLKGTHLPIQGQRNFWTCPGMCGSRFIWWSDQVRQWEPWLPWSLDVEGCQRDVGFQTGIRLIDNPLSFYTVNWYNIIHTCRCFNLSMFNFYHCMFDCFWSWSWRIATLRYRKIMTYALPPLQTIRLCAVLPSRAMVSWISGYSRYGIKPHVIHTCKLDLRDLCSNIQFK